MSINDDRYKQLQLRLKEVRMEMEKIDGSRFRALGDEIDKSNSKLGSLIKNSIRLVALHSATRFVQNIREVTSEFELQKVALGSIIQDTQRAEGLFKQIKAAAVQSPFEIKDLVTYTKQLSAYQIETEKLFDTTMRLADISAGLGVDMGRLILAFGQVRAAAVLRGQELRQFTEAGIPLVDKLAEKFEELNGRAVSTAEVFELISQRAVPFSMIEEIFNDLTSAGGAFYQMQEKQAETLLGQWNNLKDAISIMYDEIGNTKPIHNAMSDLISMAKTLMQNWRTIAEVVKAFGVSFGIVKIVSLFLPTLTKNTQLAEKAERALIRAQELEAITATKGAKARQRSIASLKLYYSYTKKAAESTTLLGRGWNNLLASMAKGGGLSLALMLLTALSGVLISVFKEANRLNKELAQIGVKGATTISQSVRTFERLAKTALEAADGSKTQRDALDELKRSFGDISPALDGHIESLRELKGNYESITNAIREKINWQIREQKITTITEDYGKKLGKDIDNVKKRLTELGFTRGEISAITDAIQDAASRGIINATSSIEEKAKVIEDIIYNLSGRVLTISRASGYGAGVARWSEYVSGFGEALGSLAETSIKMETRIQDVVKDAEDDVASMGTYAKVIKQIDKEIGEIDLKEGDKVLDPKSYAGIEKAGQETIKIFAKAIQQEFDKTKIDISSAFDPSGQIDFSVLKKAAAEASKITVTEINEATGKEVKRTPFTAIVGFVNELSKRYEDIVPSDKIAIITKRKLEEIADVTGIGMDKLRQYIKGSGTDNQEYMKFLSESIDAYNKSAEKMVAVNKAIAEGTAEKDTKPYSKEQIADTQNMAAAIQTLFVYMQKIIPLTTTTTTPRDTRLSQLKSDISELTNAYKKFKELTKYKGEESALSDINKIFPQLEGWTPTKDNLVKRLNEMLDKVKSDLARSPKSKTLLDMKRALETEISNLEFDDLKDKIETKLKNLQDEIKRSETARNFFNNILDLTGDEKLAASLTMEVYGTTGKEFKQRVQDEMFGALESVKDTMDKDVFDKFMGDVTIFDFKEIRSQLQLLPETIRPVFERLLNEQEKFEADWYQNYYKVYAKSKDYSDRLADNEKKRAQALKEARERGQDTAAVNAFYDKKAAEIQLEAMKDTYTWTKAFENLEGVSTYTLKNLIALIDEYIEKYAKDLEPQQLRELTRSRERAEAQLIERNAFEQLEDAMSDYVMAREKKAKLDKDSKEDAEAYAQAADDEADALDRASRAMDKAVGYINELASATKELLSAFASDKDASYYSEQIDNLTKSLAGAAQTAQGVMRLITSEGADPAAYVQTFTGVASFITGIVNAINAARIKKANDEIERQARALSDLEYAYGRLDKAIGDAFGNARIYNYNQQIEILKRKLDALNTQLDAERSKGNKASQDAINGYLDSIRETEAALADLQRLPAEFWAGQELTSASVAFVDSWIAAKKEFGDTASAIEETMQEMVENLVSKAAMSGVVQAVLKPWYEELNKIKSWDASTIARMVQEAYNKIPAINQGLEIAYSSLTAAGVDIRRTVGNLTGISRNYATASEESILGLTAATNTQNYYMSYMPTINDHVAAIRARLVGDGGGDTAAAPEGPTYQDQMLIYASNLPLMRSDTEAIRSMLERVIKPAGTTATHYVSVRM